MDKWAWQLEEPVGPTAQEITAQALWGWWGAGGRRGMWSPACQGADISNSSLRLNSALLHKTCGPGWGGNCEAGGTQSLPGEGSGS